MACVNSRQRAATIEEALNNQSDRTTWPVNVSQSLQLATPMLVKWAHQWNGHGGRNGSYLWAKNELPLAKVDLATATAECPFC